MHRLLFLWLLAPAVSLGQGLNSLNSLDVPMTKLAPVRPHFTTQFLKSKPDPVTTTSPSGAVKVVYQTQTRSIINGTPNDPLLARAMRATCKVRVPMGNGAAAGSGTYLGDRLVMTAAHVMDGGQIRNATCDFGNGPIQCVAFLRNKNADQYLLELERDPGVEPVPIAAASPVRGTRVFGLGYGGSSGRIGIWRGTLAGFANVEGTPAPSETATYRGDAPIPGDSGGGCFNEQGEYVGTVWGRDDNGREGSVIRHEETCDFLHRTNLFGRIFRGRGQGGGCPPGGCQPYGGGGGGGVYSEPGDGGYTPIQPAPPQQQPAPPQQPPQQQPPLVPPANGQGFVPSEPRQFDVPITVPVQPVPPSPEAVADALKKLMEAEPDKFKGPKGDKGDKGDAGLSDEAIAALKKEILQDVLAQVQTPNPSEIAMAVLQALPKKELIVIDNESGNEIGSVVLDMSQGDPVFVPVPSGGGLFAGGFDPQAISPEEAQVIGAIAQAANTLRPEPLTIDDITPEFIAEKLTAIPEEQAAALAKRIQEKLDPIYVIAADPVTGEPRRIAKKLGEDLRLLHSPKKGKK